MSFSVNDKVLVERAVIWLGAFRAASPRENGGLTQILVLRGQDVPDHVILLLLALKAVLAALGSTKPMAKVQLHHWLSNRLILAALYVLT